MIHKLLLLSILTFILSACATSPQQGDASPATQETSAAQPVESADAGPSSESATSMPAAADTFLIPLVVPYSSQSIIAENILASCTELGSQFSNAVLKYAPKFDIKVAQTADPLPIEGRVVDLTIEQAISGGNAFIGHRKSVTVAARLMVDGKMISSTRKMRNSGGGFFGGFTGSCGVLARTVNTLGSDISRWLSEQQ